MEDFVATDRKGEGCGTSAGSYKDSKSKLGEKAEETALIAPQGGRMGT